MKLTDRNPNASAAAARRAEDRLAEALRQNLARRKQQSRARAKVLHGEAEDAVSPRPEPPLNQDHRRSRN